MECYSGEVYGFLGPNGAGKTTTIKIAVGLLQLDEGEISINGKDIRKDFEGAMANVGGIVETLRCTSIFLEWKISVSMQE